MVCLKTSCVQIFERIFLHCKVNFCINASAFQENLTQYGRKCAKKMYAQGGLNKP